MRHGKSWLLRDFNVGYFKRALKVKCWDRLQEKWSWMEPERFQKWKEVSRSSASSVSSARSMRWAKRLRGLSLASRMLGRSLCLKCPRRAKWSSTRRTWPQPSTFSRCLRVGEECLFMKREFLPGCWEETQMRWCMSFQDDSDGVAIGGGGGSVCHPPLGLRGGEITRRGRDPEMERDTQRAEAALIPGLRRPAQVGFKHHEKGGWRDTIAWTSEVQWCLWWKRAPSQHGEVLSRGPPRFFARRWAPIRRWGVYAPSW